MSTKLVDYLGRICQMGHFYRDLVNKGIEILDAALSDEIMNFSNIVYLYYVLIADMKHPLQ